MVGTEAFRTYRVLRARRQPERVYFGSSVFSLKLMEKILRAPEDTNKEEETDACEDDTRAVQARRVKTNRRKAFEDMRQDG